MEEKTTTNLVNWFYIHIDESEYPAIYRLQAEAANGVYLGVLDDINAREDIPASVLSKRFFRVLSTGDEALDFGVMKFLNPNNLYFYHLQAVAHVKQYVEWKIKEFGQTVS